MHVRPKNFSNKLLTVLVLTITFNLPVESAVHKSHFKTNVSKASFQKDNFQELATVRALQAKLMFIKICSKMPWLCEGTHKLKKRGIPDLMHSEGFINNLTIIYYFCLLNSTTDKDTWQKFKKLWFKLDLEGLKYKKHLTYLVWKRTETTKKVIF